MGLGGLSGGGGTTRLLYDYAEPQRGQVLNALFLPKKGGNVQILKVEIGGGVTFLLHACILPWCEWIITCAARLLQMASRLRRRRPLICTPATISTSNAGTSGG